MAAWAVRLRPELAGNRRDSAIHGIFGDTRSGPQRAEIGPPELVVYLGRFDGPDRSPDGGSGRFKQANVATLDRRVEVLCSAEQVRERDPRRERTKKRIP